MSIKSCYKLNDLFRKRGGSEMLALKLARVKKGWTQEKLSEESDVGRVTISNIERKGIENIPVYTLRKIAKALDTTVQELFFSEEE